MTQFDLCVNPVAAARRTYPYVVVMQADVAGDEGGSRLVAPLVSQADFSPPSTKVLPVVSVGTEHFVVITPALESLPVRELRDPVGTAAGFRDALLNAIDFLFFGT
jgi:toxin CcdB